MIQESLLYIKHYTLSISRTKWCKNYFYSLSNFQFKATSFHHPEDLTIDSSVTSLAVLAYKLPSLSLYLPEFRTSCVCVCVCVCVYQNPISSITSEREKGVRRVSKSEYCFKWTVLYMCISFGHNIWKEEVCRASEPDSSVYIKVSDGTPFLSAWNGW
jgi:hypothetical protein